MTVTLKEISELANVSRVTVSRVVNNRPGVGRETRQRVLEIMERLNFSPNRAAVSLGRMRGKRESAIRTIAFLFSMEQIKKQSVEPIYTKVLDGIEQTVQLTQARLILRSLPTLEDRRRLPELIPDHFADGMILFMPRPEDQPFIDYLRSRSLPFILYQPRIQFDRSVSISTDNYDGAYQAVAHLIQCGHEHIAHIGAISNDIDAVERRRGYFSALAEMGIIVPSDYCRTGGEWCFENGYNAMGVLLQLDPRPTAVFTADDTIAIGAINRCIQEGLRVPDDMSVVGFDDMFPQLHTVPSLTTVHYDCAMMGRMAVSELLHTLEGSPITKRILAPTQLIVRSSTSVLSRTNQTEFVQSTGT